MLNSLLPLSASLPSDHVREEIPRGQNGTAATIAKMIRVAQHGKRDDRIRQLCGRVIENCGQKDYYCYAKSIHNFVTHKIKYAYDPVDVELVESAWNVVKNGIADCDSKCGLFAAMCEQVGLPTQFVTVKGNPGSNEFTHVYCRVNIPKRGWVASDTTMPNKPFGWEPKGLPEKTWDVSSESEGVFDMNAFTCEAPTLSGLEDMDGGVVDMQSQIIPMNGLGSLGDNESSLSAVIDGTVYSELRKAKDENNARMIQVGDILNKANRIADPNARALAMQKYTAAQSAVTKERASLFNAISAYNSLAQTIQTYSLGAYKPQQLGALGIPLALGALAAIGAVAAALLVFERAMSTWRGDVPISRTAIESFARAAQVAGGGSNPLTDVIRGTGDLMSYAIIGGVAFVGFLVLRKMKRA